MEIDDVYSDLIMEHSLNSLNKRKLDYANLILPGKNPSCGDEITLEIQTENGIIKDIAFLGSGCAISQSSTSIMADTLRGETIESAKKIATTFLKMIRREKLTKKEKLLLKDSVAFENISNMPARVKCALLPWHTILSALSNTQNQ
jgi:nitrogen fixation protein NifU and related proteins